MKFEAIYIIYDNEESPVFVGNTKECISFLNMTQDSFYCLVSRTKSGIIKGRKYLAYKVEEDTKDLEVK